LSNRISVGGGTGSVTSNELSASLNISARSIGVSVKGLQSAANALSNTISDAVSVGSATAAFISNQIISVDARITSVYDRSRVRLLAAAATVSATALTDISGFSLGVSAGDTYQMEAVILYIKGAATQSYRFGMTFPAMTLARGTAQGFVSTNNQATSVTVSNIGQRVIWDGDSASGSIIISTLSGALVSSLVHFNGVFVVSTTGVLQFQCGASTGATAAIIQPGSYVKLFRLS